MWICVTVTIKISKQLHNQLKLKFNDDDIDSIAETILSKYVQGDLTEELDLIRKLNNKRVELINLESELLEFYEAHNIVDENDFNKVLETINRIYTNTGMIGRNQVKSISNRKKVPYSHVISYLKDNDYNIVNYTGLKK